MQNLTMDNIAWSSKILSNLKQMCYPQKKMRKKKKKSIGVITFHINLSLSYMH